ncbi:MAG TPA: patatin-like phospholipase family protein [Gemmatimonadales bacterium]|nr:patatin-like phospholipase family protein [Gemmatimonadales bacterium]
MPKVVAVFGGGGAKSVAHVGAAKALAEAGLIPSCYVGTSFGAVMAAALASGTTPAALTDQLLHPSTRPVVSLDYVALAKGFFSDHLLKPGPLREVIARIVPARRFESLRVPLQITATDLDSGELVVFGDDGTDLHDALYASCALPLYYPPAEIGGRHLADGGLRAVLPLGPAKGIPADLVVAVHVGPGFDEGPPRPSVSKLMPPALVRAHGSSERIMMAAQAEQAVRDWPNNGAKLVVVRPVHEREATFAVQNIQRYITAGYEATKQAL